MKQINLYTDGSCLGNPGKGGYGAILQYQENVKELSGGFLLTTNNRMEIFAVIKGLEALKEPCFVNVYTDSQYVAKAIKEGWLTNWQKNGWKTANKKDVKNKDLWLLLHNLLQIHKVNFHWLKGHAGHPQNERCDELARIEANKNNLPQDIYYKE